MPDDLQLYQNACRIRRESTLGDAGGDATILRARLSGASIVRDIAGVQERVGPFRTREFLNAVHVAWEIEIRGEIRTGGFVPWLLSHVATENGTERSLTIHEIPYDPGDPATFAIQFDGIEGTSTFVAAALKRIQIDFRGRRALTYSAVFVALLRTDAISAWTTTDTEGGDILSTSGSRISLASDFGGQPANFALTGYEASVEIGIPDMEATAFSADGVPQKFSRDGNWDVTGRILMPEAIGITDAALETVWNGNLNLRAGPGETDSTLEIEAGITAMIERRTAIADDWKQASLDFVSRRSTVNPVARILTDQPEF